MWVEKTKNGKFNFVERYENPLTGKKGKVSVVLDKDTAQTRKKAALVLQEKIVAELSKVPVKESNLTLKELVDLYRIDQLASVAKSTYKRNFHAANRLMEILGPDTLVDKITAGYIKDAFNRSGEAPSTLNGRIVRIKALFRWAYQNDYVSDIRFLDKIVPFSDRTRKEKLANKFLEAHELKKVLEAIPNEKWKLLAELTVLSGMRIGEAIALEIKDLDFEHKLIHITKNYDYINNLVTAPKTASSVRDVYMQPELEAVCIKIRKLSLKEKMQYGHHSNLLFSDANGEHVKFYTYLKHLRTSSMRAIGRDITSHVMRHTHVALMAEAGVPLEAITRRLGHEDSRITKDVYYHVTKKQREKDNAQFAKVVIL